MSDQVPEVYVRENPSYGRWRGQVMQIVEDQTTGDKIEIRFSKKEKRFYFEADGSFYSCAWIEPLEPKAYEVLRSRRQINFVPVIVAAYSDGVSGGNYYSSNFVESELSRIGLELSYGRAWIGHHPPSMSVRLVSWSQRKWLLDQYLDEEDAEAQIMARMVGTSHKLWSELDALPEFPYRPREEKSITWITYSDEMWSTLEELQATIERVGKHLDEILSPEKILQLAGANLLPSGKSAPLEVEHV